MNTILSLDIGTSSTRAGLYRAEDVQAIEGAWAQHAHTPTLTPDGGSTLDPRALLAELVACSEQALAAAPRGAQIVGVGMSCFWHSFVGVDEAGEPLTPLLLWNDRRSAPQAARLRAMLPDAPERTGCPWHASYVPARLLWLAESDPALFARCSRFLSPAAYLFERLFGASGESHSMASGSGLLDQSRGVWDEAVLEAIGLDAGQLAPLSATPSVGLRPEYAARLPALAGVPWFPPLGDGVASNLGCGATTPENIALMIGTSGAIRTLLRPDAPCPALPEGLWRYQLSPGQFALGGALTNGGAVWAWLRQTLALESVSEAALSALAPDGHGLTVLPFLMGERAPLWRDDLKGVVFGLSASTTPAELARAHMEAVALRFALLRERLRPVAPEAKLIATGGALRDSPTWAQVLADALGEELHLKDEPEGSARGAALWACEGLRPGSIERVPPPPDRCIFTPRASATVAYRRAGERQQALLATLFPEAPLQGARGGDPVVR